MSSWQTFRLVGLMFLLGGASVASYLFYEHELYFCVFFSCVLALVIMACLVSIYYSSIRRMERVIGSIRHGDFMLNFSAAGRSEVERKMVESLNEVILRFRTDLSEKQEKHQYFETLLDTVDTSMLVADKQGIVMWMNRAGVQDLCGHAIHQLDELKVLNPDFPLLLKALQPGEVKVIRIYKEEVMQDLAVTVTEYSTPAADLRLINLKNIRSILEENEMEAWQKLVRVLTHEIMNSITPIISLSDTLCERAIQQGMEEESLMLQGMKTIDCQRPCWRRWRWASYWATSRSCSRHLKYAIYIRWRMRAGS